MSKSLGFALLAGLLTCSGCITGFTTQTTPTTPAPIVAMKTFPPVTAEQISAGNAHQVAQALSDEIDRETQEGMLTPR